MLRGAAIGSASKFLQRMVGSHDVKVVTLTPRKTLKTDDLITPKTAFPIYMIGSSNMHHCVNSSCFKSNTTPADVAALAAFAFIEGSFSPNEIALMRRQSPSRPTDFTLYVESAIRGERHVEGSVAGRARIRAWRARLRARRLPQIARYFLKGNLTAPMPKEAESLQLCATSQFLSAASSLRGCGRARPTALRSTQSAATDTSLLCEWATS